MFLRMRWIFLLNSVITRTLKLLILCGYTKGSNFFLGRDGVGKGGGGGLKCAVNFVCIIVYVFATLQRSASRIPTLSMLL